MDDWSEEEDLDSVMISTLAHALTDFAETLPSGTEVCTYELLEQVVARDACIARLLAPYVGHSDGDVQRDSPSRYPMALLFDLDESMCELLKEHGIYPDTLEDAYAAVGLPHLVPYQLRRKVDPEVIAARGEAPALEGLRFNTESFWTGGDDFIAVRENGLPHFAHFRSHVDEQAEHLVCGRLTQGQWSELECALRDLNVYSWPTAPDLQVLDAPSWTLVVTFEGGRYFKAEGNIEQPQNFDQLFGILQALEPEDS